LFLTHQEFDGAEPMPSPRPVKMQNPARSWAAGFQ